MQKKTDAATARRNVRHALKTAQLLAWVNLVFSFCLSAILAWTMLRLGQSFQMITNNIRYISRLKNEIDTLRDASAVSRNGAGQPRKGRVEEGK